MDVNELLASLPLHHDLILNWLTLIGNWYIFTTSET